MEVINLDLGDDISKTLDMGDSNSNSKPQKINIIKNDTSTESKSLNLEPNLSVSSGSNSSIGLDLLMNKTKKKSDSNSSISGNSETFKPINIEPPKESSSIFSKTSSKPEEKKDSLDDILSDINLDSLDLGDSSTSKTSSGPSLNSNSKPETINLDDDIFSTLNTEPTPSVATPKEKTYEELQKEKFELLCQLERLENKGIKMQKKFSMTSSYEEMKYEFDRIVNNREVQQSVKFQRKMLVAFVTAIEFLNNRFDPMDVKLDGWSESIHENLNDYDDVFEELHEKYKSKAKMAPEIKLLLMLGGSGFMFHLTNTMFKSSLPGMGDIMKQNPDLMQQFAKAAVNTMNTNEDSGGLGNLMNDMVDMSGQRKNSNRRNVGNSNGKRAEMSGPPDLDSILEQLSDNNVNNTRSVNLDSDISDSDIDSNNTKNIDIGNMGRRRRNNDASSINLDL